MKTFFEDLYRNKYRIEVPKITSVKGGIYIYTDPSNKVNKIFISQEDWRQNKQFYETFLEEVDVRVINKVENK